MTLPDPLHPARIPGRRGRPPTARPAAPPIRFIERPTALENVLVDTPLHRALLETARNGKAVAVPLHGQRAALVQSNLRAWLRRRGYQLHYRAVGDQFLTAWATDLRGTP